jgi:serine O-acetyltransferase
MKSKALYTDICRTYVFLEGGKAKKVIGCLRSPGVQAVAVYRFGRWIWTCPVPLRVILTPHLYHIEWVH